MPRKILSSCTFHYKLKPFHRNMIVWFWGRLRYHIQAKYKLSEKTEGSNLFLKSTQLTINKKKAISD